MRYPLALLVLFLLAATALGIAPWYRQDWALENALAVVGVLALVLSYRRMPLSRVSYTLIFAFLMLHELGAHYTYSEVPYDAWFERLTGETLSARLGLERNHYDRLVHFSYGLLLAYPFRELFVRVAEARGFWGYFLPLDVVMSTSMLYEIIEWVAALVMGGELGQAYLGTQGDVWDAQKDMGVASLGAVLAMGVAMLIDLRTDPGFGDEFRTSLGG